MGMSAPFPHANPYGAARGRRHDVPRPIRRPEHGDVCLPVAVVVPGRRDVRPVAPCEAVRRRTRGRHNVPRPVRRPEHRNVSLPVAVEVPGRRDVGAVAPRETVRRRTRGRHDVPRAVRRPEHGDVSSSRRRRNRAATGMSAPFPHANAIGVPVVDGTTYHCPVDGRNTAMSVFPSPSKSPVLTGQAFPSHRTKARRHCCSAPRHCAGRQRSGTTPGTPATVPVPSRCGRVRHRERDEEGASSWDSGDVPWRPR